MRNGYRTNRDSKETPIRCTFFSNQTCSLTIIYTSLASMQPRISEQKPIHSPVGYSSELAKCVLKLPAQIYLSIEQFINGQTPRGSVRCADTAHAVQRAKEQMSLSMLETNGYNHHEPGNMWSDEKRFTQPSAHKNNDCTLNSKRVTLVNLPRTHHSRSINNFTAVVYTGTVWRGV